MQRLPHPGRPWSLRRAPIAPAPAQSMSRQTNHRILRPSFRVDTPMPHTTQRRITDAPTRLFHWAFATCFIGAYLSSDSERLLKIHAAMGYSMVVLLVFRLLYGWFGPRPMRWSALRSK